MRTFIRAGLLAGAAFMTGICGCGGSAGTARCTLTTVINVNPTSATVSHAATPPTNQVQFIAAGGYAAPAGSENCAIPAIAWIEYGTWSNPDPNDIEISSASDNTNGTAVCEAATKGAVTLTGTFTDRLTSPVTRTVQLTCN
jgi:hypothetical protein